MESFCVAPLGGTNGFFVFVAFRDPCVFVCAGGVVRALLCTNVCMSVCVCVFVRARGVVRALLCMHMCVSLRVCVQSFGVQSFGVQSSGG